MFGRITFLYFLQRKGWLNGDKQYMHNLFYNSDKKDDFLDGVLEILFFNVLNEDKRYRDNSVDELPGGRNIPYLNGGLFAKDDDDEKTCVFPEDYFKRLFDFLDSYNFTIDENDAEDAEIGIDPEMLGRIFESLLEDNKDKGAYYTPKEIVSYMCRESIINFLIADMPESLHENVRHLVETYDASKLDDNTKLTIRRKLQGLRICDPAIGSGAFPMGLVNLLSRLYIAMKADTDTTKMKRHIMENNIYGVDIEKGAVDIARLRFWLAMIVEEKDPMPLPNLHFKIMRGNSLLETYRGLDLSDLTKVNAQKSFWDSENHEREELISNLKGYYSESNHTERSRKFNSIINNVRRQIHAKDQNLSQKGLDPSDNSLFFLWHTWFTDVFEKGGFDIVIGNPPYGATISESQKDMYREIFPETEFKIDTYSLFVLLSFKLLKNEGVMYYIIPNTLLDNYFEENVRKKLLAHTILEINDLSDHVFPNAVVHSMIFGYEKKIQKNNYSIKVNISEELESEPQYIESDFFKAQQKTLFSIRMYNSWGLLKKLKTNSKKLVEVLNIRQAIKTGDDKTYITPNKIADNYKPILRGKDIKRFSISSPGLYVNYGNFLACPRTPDIFEQPKILIREAGARITAAIDYDNHYIMSSLYNAILIDEKFSLEYLLGLINSTLFQFLMNKLTFEKTKGAFTKAKIYHYYELPIKVVENEVQDKIGEIVKRISASSNEMVSSSSGEKLLDIAVYHIYDITYDEILAIDPETTITKEEYNNYE